MLDFRKVLSYRKTSPNQQQYFRLLELPIELQEMIFDCCYQPWDLEIVDDYWQMCESPYFCLDSYSQNPDYSAVVLYGAPSASLSMTCRYIYHHTETSLLKSYTGILKIHTRSSHSKLPEISLRFSTIYGLTTHLELEQRTFVDLFCPADFPLLKKLTIGCWPIFWPDNFIGRTHPWSDEEFQEWAKESQRPLERKSRKRLITDKFLTVLKTSADQSGEPDENVYCYLAEEQDDVRVVREWLTAEEEEAEQTLGEVASWEAKNNLQTVSNVYKIVIPCQEGSNIKVSSLSMASAVQVARIYTGCAADSMYNGNVPSRSASSFCQLYLSRAQLCCSQSKQTEAQRLVVHGHASVMWHMPKW